MAWLDLIALSCTFRISDKHIEPFTVFGVDWFVYNSMLYAKTPDGALCVSDRQRDAKSYKKVLVKFGASALSEQVKRYALLYKIQRGYDASIWLATKLIGVDK